MLQYIICNFFKIKTNLTPRRPFVESEIDLIKMVERMKRVDEEAEKLLLKLKVEKIIDRIIKE